MDGRFVLFVVSVVSTPFYSEGGGLSPFSFVHVCLFPLCLV